MRDATSPKDENEEDEEEYGPTLPHPISDRDGRGWRGGMHSGPTIPSMEDLELKRGT